MAEINNSQEEGATMSTDNVVKMDVGHSGMEEDAPLDDSQRTEGADEESDDDLLAPTTFLYGTKSYKEIHTPEKILTPTGDNLSPITPFAVQGRAKKRKVPKFTLSKLVTEKSVQDEIDKKLSKMDQELRKGIEEGGILNMIVKNEANLVDETPLDSSQEGDELLPQHRKELERERQGLKNDFPDGFPGDILFTYEPLAVDLTPPDELKSIIGFRKHGTRNTSTSNKLDPLAREFLISGFLVDMALFKKTVDSSVMKWLLSCICHSNDYEVIEGAFKAFWAITTTMKEELTWQFTAEKFWNLLSGMGASEKDVFRVDTLKDLLPPQKESDMKYFERKSRDTDKDLSRIFLHQVQTLVKAFVGFVKCHPESFNKTDAMFTVLLAFRLGISMEVIMCSWEVQVLVGCVIEVYSEEDWHEEMVKICQNLTKLSEHHSNKLQLVEMIPITERGRELKKILALTMLSTVCAVRDLGVISFRKYITASPVSMVYEIISKLRTINDTDFHLFFTKMSFINHCLPDESISAGEKKALENLIGVLRRMNCEIRDPGGRFMNRTKVKDLILRTVSRLTHIARGLQTQSKLDGFFEETNSSFDQLKFETIEDQPEKAERRDEDELDEALPQADQPSSSSSFGTSSEGFITDDEMERLNEDPLADLEERKMSKLPNTS